MLVKTITKFASIEKESLEAHVEMCASRHKVLEDRLNQSEEEIAKVEAAAANFRGFVVKAIGVATGTLSFVITLTLVILDRLH